MRALALASIVASAVVFACASREGTPGAVYRSFVRAVADRDADRAWSLLSSDTQAWLEARAGAAASAAPGVIAPSARQMLVGTASRSARPLTSVVVARESRDRAILEVEEEGGTRRQVELVREGGWRVRIPAPTS